MESERVCGVVLALRRLIPHCHLYPGLSFSRCLYAALDPLRTNVQANLGIGNPYMGMTHAGSVTLHFVNSIEHKKFEGAL